MKYRVPLNASTFGKEEIQSAVDVLNSGMVTMGQKVIEFEQAFAKYIGTREAVFVNSGSSANLLALFAMANPLAKKWANRKPMAPGSEVVVPALTWSTTVWPIIQAGAIPVLVDSDPETLQLKVDQVEEALSNQTSALCPVHILGNGVPMDPLVKIAKENHLWLIEDTCESLGTTHKGKKVGTFGDFGTYSFFFSHHITTIEGGMITTDDENLGEILRSLRAHGWTRHLKNREKIEKSYPDLDPRFLFVTTGFNVRPTEINAAFGLHQLKKLDGFNRKRADVAKFWLESLSSQIEHGDLRPMKTTPDTESTWFGFPVLCKTREIRDRFRDHLENKGIETRPIIAGNLARQPAFEHIKHRVVGDLRGANEVMDCGVYWGSHPLMSQEEVEYVSKVVKEFRF